MKEITIIQEFQKQGGAIINLQQVVNALIEKAVGTEARIRCHEDLLLSRGGFLWTAIRNLFCPGRVRSELTARFKAYAEAATPKTEATQ